MSRLTKALSVFNNLIQEGANIQDDGVVGDAFAKAGVYTFREQQNRTVEDLLAEEHRKDIGSQGTRTCARELRRFFSLLGFLTLSSPQGWTLTAEGTRLTEFLVDPLHPEAKIIWKTALRNMALTDEAGTSHPYLILLRLVEENPGIDTQMLGLCFEVSDDSDQEFRRINQLVISGSGIEVFESLGISRHQMRNSVKILPSIARQIGDIRESNDKCFREETAELEPEPTTRSRSQSILRRRPYVPTSAQESHIVTPECPGPHIREYDADLVAERSQDHDECIRKLSILIPMEFEQYEGLYDFLAVDASKALLAEVKTIRDDEARQVRLALGQLLYYEYFEVQPLYPTHEVHKIFVTDQPVTNEIVAFLDGVNVGVVWLPRDQDYGCSSLGQRILQSFAVDFPLHH